MSLKRLQSIIEEAGSNVRGRGEKGVEVEAHITIRPKGCEVEIDAKQGGTMKFVPNVSVHTSNHDITYTSIDELCERIIDDMAVACLRTVADKPSTKVTRKR